MQKQGVTSKAFAPFILMCTSAVIFIIANTFKERTPADLSFQLPPVKLLALILFDISANYFAVNEPGGQLFSLAANMPVELSIVYWIFTVPIAVSYILYGIIKKDLLFIRTGIVLSIAAILTIRYYYKLFPAEIDMLIGGLLLIVISYALIQYLRIPKHVFTFQIQIAIKKIY